MSKHAMCHGAIQDRRDHSTVHYSPVALKSFVTGKRGGNASVISIEKIQLQTSAIRQTAHNTIWVDSSDHVGDVVFFYSNTHEHALLPD